MEKNLSLTEDEVLKIWEAIITKLLELKNDIAVLNSTSETDPKIKHICRGMAELAQNDYDQLRGILVKIQKQTQINGNSNTNN